MSGEVDPSTGESTSAGGGSGGAGGSDAGNGGPDDPGDVIKQLVEDPNRMPTVEELDALRERVSAADFNARLMETPDGLVGQTFGGRTLRERESSFTVHAAQRVLINEQWASGTTREEYLADLRRAASHPDASFAVYETRDTYILALLAPIEGTVPEERRGSRSGTLVQVIYSANRGRITTGMQTDEPEGNIPRRRRWISGPRAENP